jgi:pyruvate dehydrogenase E2 component (dihydrolipoamide acetyltransferase)
MSQPVIMPKQGQSVETCILTEWFKQKGEQVSKGDLLFSYETDKAAFEEEAKMDGILLERFYEAGDEVPVLSNVAVIGMEGESVDDFRQEGKESAETVDYPEGKKSQRSGSDAPERVSEIDEETTAETLRISPRAGRLAAQWKIDVSSLKGSGPGGRIVEQDVIQAFRQQPKITPLAREMMKRENLVYDKEKARERVTSKDLVERRRIDPEGTEIRPLSNIRKRIAEAMHRSLHHAAQLTHHTSADARKILELREKVKKATAKGRAPDITLNDMICFAVIKALLKHPEVNAHFLDDQIKLFRNVNLGFAVDTERGLMVPTVVEAEKLSLAELSLQLNEMAARCRKGNVDPDLLSPESAGFTVSNLGAYGVEMFTPVINLPQVAILGVNAIVNRPAELEVGKIGIIPFIGLSLTYDHRALDGGPASLFLKEVKEQIERFEGEGMEW